MGILLILLSSVAFALSSYFGKIALNLTNMSGIINSFSRFFVGMIFLLIYILITKKSFKPKDFKPIFFRALFNSIAILMLSKSLEFTTITNGNMLHMTYPVFVILLAPKFTGEKVEKKTYLYLALAMIGSYIVANPSFGSVNKGDILAFVSALVASFSIMNLSLARKENEGYLIVFYVMLIGTVINLPFAYNDLINFEMIGFWPVFLSGFSGLVGQVLLTRGYKYVDSPTGSLVASSRIVISGIIGYILLGEEIGSRTIIGMLMITAALVAASGYFDRRVAKN